MSSFFEASGAVALERHYTLAWYFVYAGLEVVRTHVWIRRSAVESFVSSLEVQTKRGVEIYHLGAKEEALLEPVGLREVA